MILISRPSDVPTPFPIHTLDDDLLAFLERPNEGNAAAGDGLQATTTTPNNPETRDRLLAYAYLIHDAAVTRQLPQGSIPPGHSALLLPLMDLLHALHPHNSPIALLLGCVYYHYDLTQRSIDINRHILQYDPQNVSAMCNLGVIFHFMHRLAEAFGWWWKALQLPPISWDVLDNILELFLGSKDFSNILPRVDDDHNTPHVLQIRRNSLQVCNSVIGHLSGHQLRAKEIYRAQNTFRLRALLLRYFQEAGDWEDIAEGIELGINTTVTPLAGSVRPKETTLDDLLLQVHSIGKSICGITNTVADAQEGFDGVRDPSEVPEQELLQPALLLFPEEVMRLPLVLWPLTSGSLPSIATSAVPGDLQDGVRMESLKAPTNMATSRLLRAWVMGVQGYLGTGPSTSRGQATPAAIPCSRFQATQSLIILAEYLALSLYPTAVSYNDLGILLSFADNQRRVFQPSGSNSTKEITGRNLSRLYFEAGLEVDPRNAHLLANLGSYWKKEGDYEEAIRYYQQALALNPEFAAPRVYLEQTLRETGQGFEGASEEPIYQKFD